MTQARGVVLAAGLLLMQLALTHESAAQNADSTAAADSLLIKELEAELGASDAASESTSQRPGTAVRNTPNLNPNISVIGDFRASYTSDARRTLDTELHEVETALQAVVDPYARADVYISAAHAGDGEFTFEIEEAYLTTLSLPHRLQARAGKFRSVFGKLNRKHPHSLPFIDAPSVYVNYLGDEGLNDQGVSLSWLVPNSRFYQDITVEATRGPGESESFSVQESNKFLYVAHLKNFWDLSENATLELGFSGAAGPNQTGESTLLGGVDVTYKWKPLRFNTYRAVELQAESFFSRMNVDVGDPVDTWGMFALANAKVARRWGVVGRFDYSDLPDDPNWNETAFSATARWEATEFQKLELGVKSTAAAEMDRNLQVLFRAVFVIGAHGAHEY